VLLHVQLVLPLLALVAASSHALARQDTASSLPRTVQLLQPYLISQLLLQFLGWPRHEGVPGACGNG
jgi:hypothetical protein